MKIKLIKDEQISGKVWYKVYLDDSMQETFNESELPKALEYMDTLKDRLANGYPKTTTIKEYELPSNS